MSFLDEMDVTPKNKEDWSDCDFTVEQKDTFY